MYKDYTYIRNGEFCGTINWRCSAYRKQKCKAKAITIKHNGEEYVKLSHPVHSHAPREGNDLSHHRKKTLEGADYLRSDGVDDDIFFA